MDRQPAQFGLVIINNDPPGLLTFSIARVPAITAFAQIILKIKRRADSADGKTLLAGTVEQYGHATRAAQAETIQLQD